LNLGMCLGAFSGVPTPRSPVTSTPGSTVHGPAVPLFSHAFLDTGR
jgi:hypothetical protein